MLDVPIELYFIKLWLIISFLFTLSAVAGTAGNFDFQWLIITEPDWLMAIDGPTPARDILPTKLWPSLLFPEIFELSSIYVFYIPLIFKSS